MGFNSAFKGLNSTLPRFCLVRCSGKLRYKVTFNFTLKFYGRNGAYGGKV